MASKIEWTDETWNPIRAENLETGGVGHFCVKVSAGCQGCYAEAMQKRLFNNPVRYAAQDRAKVRVFLDEAVLLKPFTWKQPRVVFPCSMTDLFGDWVEDRMLDLIFAVMALTPQHTYKILTKRPERQRDYINGARARFASEILGTYEMIYNAMGWLGRKNLRDPHPYRKAFPQGMPWPLPNVQLGTSVEDQESAKLRLPALAATEAAVLIVSYEPALGPVDWRAIRWGHMPVLARFAQIIAGGQSGPGAAPAHPDWFRATRDQCLASGTAFFFKQWGEHLVGERTPPERGGNGHGLPLRFQDGKTFNVVDDGTDIILASADDEKEGPTKIWREFHGWRGQLTRRVGKKAAGRLLDGREWNEQPQPFATGGVVKAGPYLAGERGGEFQP
jgi:protein gp37